MKRNNIITILLGTVLIVGVVISLQFLKHETNNNAQTNMNAIEKREKHSYKKDGLKPLRRSKVEIELHKKMITEYLSINKDFKTLWEPDQNLKSLGLVPKWIEAGPNGATTKNPVDEGRTINGRVIAIEQDYSNRNIVYAGTPGGGIWRSTNAGKNWKPAGDHLLGLAVNTIACNTNIPGQVWFGSGAPYNGINGGEYSPAGYVYKSDDYGINWKEVAISNLLPTAVKITKIVLPAIAPNVVFVSTNAGLYMSVNYGQTFSLVTTANYNISDMVDVSTFAVVGTSTLRLLCGVNGGNNVIRLTWPSTSPSSVNPSNTSFISLPGVLNPSRMVLTSSRTYSHQYVYINVANTSDNFAGIWLSTDRGATFRQKSIPNQAGQMNFNNAITVNNFNGKHVYVTGGTNTQYYYSLDSTINWLTSTAPAGIHADQHVFTTSWVNNDTAYCGSDGGIHIITNQGASFWQYGRIRNIEAYNISINPYDPFDRYIGTQDNGVLHTFSGLRSDWEFVLGGDGWDAAHASTRHICSNFGGGPGAIYSWETNSGTYIGTLNPFSTGIGNLGSQIYLKYNGANFYAGGGLFVYKTNGINLPWSIVGGNSPTLPGGLFGMDVSPTPYNKVAAACEGGSGKIPVRTTNASGNFVAPNSGSSSNSSWWEGKTCWDIKFGTFNSATSNHRMYGLLSGWGKRIVKSEDGGASFTDITGNLLTDSLVDVNIIVPDPVDPNILYVAGDLGIFATIDGGANWFNFSNNLPTYAYVHDMEMTTINGIRYLFIATAGRGVWYCKAINLNPRLAAQTDNKNNVLVGTFPNPVVDKLTLVIDDAEADLVDVSIHDASGKNVLTTKLLIKGFENTLDCSHLKKGIYFVKIRYKDRNLVSKFVKS